MAAHHHAQAGAAGLAAAVASGTLFGNSQQVPKVSAGVEPVEAKELQARGGMQGAAAIGFALKNDLMHEALHVACRCM